MATTISIDSIDFANVQFNTPQFQNNNNTKELRGTNPSINKLYDIIKNIDKNTINQDLQNQINLYAKGSNQQAKQQCYDKIKIIEQQESNYDCLLTYADTTRIKSSFNYPNIATYNYIYFNESTYQNVINGLDKYNYTEQIYLSNSRIFFDIDFDTHKNTIEELIQLLNFIEEFTRQFTEEPLIPYGIIEYSSRFDISQLKDLPLFQEHVFNPEQSKITIMIFENQHPEFTKDLSTHIYLNGYAPRDKIENYMKYYIPSDFCPKLFDRSVYKTTKQALRQSFSPKVDVQAKTVRPLPDSMIPFIKQWYNNPIIKNVMLNLRGAPMISDTLINLPEPQISTSNPISKISFSKNSSNSSNSSKSIFSYISVGSGRGKKIESLSGLVKGGESAYKVSQLLMPYKSFVLTEEEFEAEIKLLIPDLKTEEWNDVANEEWINNKLLPIVKYQQDLTNIIPLYTLKRNIYAKIEEQKILIKIEEKSGNPDISKLNEYDNQIEMLNEIIERIDQYIDIYKYISFASHSFYDINLPENIRKHKKDERVLYNIYKLDDGQYVEAFPRGVIYKNQKAFKDHFKYSGETIDYIERCLTVYHSTSQFNFYRSQYLYLSSNKEQLLNNVHDLISILRQTFKSEDDFKYYMGFLAMKIRNLTTLNKGIISQPDGKSSGKDALKTFITDLVSSFISIKKCTVEQFNNRLNGEYLKGDLVIFEEMPSNIKEVNLLVNNIKSYSSSRMVNAECKGVDAVEIDNNFDFIINSNHNLSQLFYNKQDCEALLKRFKVLTRKSLNMNDEFIRRTMDKFGWQNQSKSERAAAEYAFYIYLKENDELLPYIEAYKILRDKQNEVEEIYSLAGVEDTAADKILTGEKIDDFVQRFKKDFINEYKRINKTKLADTLKNTMPAFKNWAQKTIIHEIETSGIFKFSSDKKLLYSSDEQIKDFYNKYYSYDPSLIISF